MIRYTDPYTYKVYNVPEDQLSIVIPVQDITHRINKGEVAPGKVITPVYCTCGNIAIRSSKDDNLYCRVCLCPSSDCLCNEIKNARSANRQSIQQYVEQLKMQEAEANEAKKVAQRKRMQKLKINTEEALMQPLVNPAAELFEKMYSVDSTATVSNNTSISNGTSDFFSGVITYTEVK